MAQAKTQFAIFLIQTGRSFEAMLEAARASEQLGYHSLWVADHMWNLANPNSDYLECLSLMTGLLAKTERVRIGALVICSLYRNPALLAKALASLDHVGRGRLEIGLGAGWMRPEFIAYGYDFPPIGVRLKRLEDTLRIVKALFSEEPAATVAGHFHRVTEAYNFPKPIQKPHPPITIGGNGKRVMLRIVAQYADRWNITAGYDNLDELIAILKQHCQSVGRDFGSLQLSEQLLVCIGRDQAEVAQRWQSAARLRPFSLTGIKGTPTEIVAALRARIAKGISMFTVIPAEPVADTMKLFAEQVMPEFK
ncbi:MAG TPA: LLM class flavin-dependent oxidoreductase [Candidatus Binataceae bacterium]|nr:LLM class flavin-dependent oxidoreductase [Candidatus Binataceae bacterium]